MPEQPKQFCAYKKCNISFGSAEKRIASGLNQVMHEACYINHLRDTRAEIDTAAQSTKERKQIPRRPIWRRHRGIWANIY